MGTSEDAGEQQADEDGEGPVAYQELFLSFSSMIVTPYLPLSRWWTFPATGDARWKDSISFMSKPRKEAAR